MTDPSGNHDTATPEGLSAAKEWAQRTIDMLAPGGLWMIPRSHTAYAFDKPHKTYRRVIGGGDSSVETVLLAMGWSNNTTHQSAQS